MLQLQKISWIVFCAFLVSSLPANSAKIGEDLSAFGIALSKELPSNLIQKAIENKKQGSLTSNISIDPPQPYPAFSVYTLTVDLEKKIAVQIGAYGKAWGKTDNSPCEEETSKLLSILTDKYGSPDKPDESSMTAGNTIEKIVVHRFGDENGFNIKLEQKILIVKHGYGATGVDTKCDYTLKYRDGNALKEIEQKNTSKREAEEKQKYEAAERVRKSASGAL